MVQGEKVESLQGRIAQGVRAAQRGLLINAALAVVKVLTGLIGNSYALIADGVESGADIFSSLIVWRGLKISGRSADEEFHFGYGKAESLASAIVALMLLGAAVGVAIAAVREVVTPHHLPEPFTLIVLVLVMGIKEVMFRRTMRVGSETGSNAVQADAWHHRSDAITSLAAFVGISVALAGGSGWESADDYAALLSSMVIGWNGYCLLRPAISDLMDKAPDREFVDNVTSVALAVAGVLGIEKVAARKVGLGYFIEIHVQALPTLPLYDAHILGGIVKSRLKEAMPSILGVLVHMEPFPAE